MIIPNKTLVKWKSAIEYGSLKKIAKDAGVHYTTVSRAIKSKKCKAELFDKINKSLEPIINKTN